MTICISSGVVISSHFLRNVRVRLSLDHIRASVPTGPIATRSREGRDTRLTDHQGWPT